ncbi:DUF4282 domain-containing protein [Gilliamella sp. wkB112]|uniref:DUF4282 domain-containing protein n=1 Tax=Gilliamella sp. wkB112 TaxID=3120257 RepID=UPI00080E1ED7|nr:DUF4282 domain-containing protein [Gilliamella apicola]OCG03093.1 hypothetical protein A9G12_09270 [Gilliamella apicola]
MKNNINLKDISFKDFFFFNKLLTPVFITIIFWVAIAVIIVSGLSIILSSLTLFKYNASMGMIAFFGGIFTIIGGLVSTRIVFEIICVLFNINRNIEKLASESTDTKEAINNNTDNQ